jgi:parallel beta-helix repeat protein
MKRLIFAALLLSVTSSAFASHPLFAKRVDYRVDTSPNAVCSADFDGDGRPDIAASNEGSNSVSVLKNSGGGFGAAVNYPVGAAPRSITCADFNKDGRVDLAVANTGSNTVSVLLNAGNGTFESASYYGTGSAPFFVASADIDGDGSVDLVVANELSGTVSILRNNGDGTFASAVGYAAGQTPYGLVAADLDDDGKVDLAVTNFRASTISVMINAGNGTFKAPVSYEVGRSPWSVTAADLDGDGKVDLITANTYALTLSVLKGNGDGSFGAATAIPLSGRPISVAVADFDGDLKPDLAVAGTSSDSVSILINAGNGTFTLGTAVKTGTTPFLLVASDIDGNGKPDLAVANSGDNSVSVLTNKTVSPRAPRILHVPRQYATVQEGIDSTVDGDTVIVAPGKYAESIDFSGKAIKVIGVAGAAATTLLPDSGSAAAVKMVGAAGAGTEFSGFTVVARTVLSPVQLAGQTRGTIRNCVFTGYGGEEVVIRCAVDDALIMQNVFYENGGIACIGIYNGSARIINNTFDRNNRGIFSVTGKGEVRNNVVANSVGYGVNGPFSVLQYNDLWNNYPNYYNCSAGLGCKSADPHFTDSDRHDYRLAWPSPCIDSGDPNPIYIDPDKSRNDMGAMPTAGLIPMAENIKLDAEDMVHVLNHAPSVYWHLRDTGLTQLAYQLTLSSKEGDTDRLIFRLPPVSSADTVARLSSVSLIDGMTYSLGITLYDEAGPGVTVATPFHMNSRPTVPTPVRPLAGTPTGYRGMAAVAKNATDVEGDSLTYDFELYADSALTTLVDRQTAIRQTKDSTKVSWPVLIPGTRYWWRTRSFDGREYSDWSSPIGFAVRPGRRLRVPSEITTVQAGLNIATPGDTVLVAPGNYAERLHFVSKGVILLSEGGFAVTRLRTVTCDSGLDSIVVIDGFNLSMTYAVRAFQSTVIVQNCCVERGTIDCYQSGMTIRHNLIKNNTWSSECSLGITSNSGRTVEVAYNDFTWSTDPNGGSYGSGFPAILCNTTDTVNIHHNLIRNFLPIDDVSLMGDPVSGIVLQGTCPNVRIFNNTITGNTRGISTQAMSQPTVWNNVVTSNRLAGIPSTITASDYNDCWNNGISADNPGVHGISVDPLFLDTAAGLYALRSGSGCIDAGDPSPAYDDSDGTRSDLGAFAHHYEYPLAADINLGAEQIGHVRSRTPVFHWCVRTQGAAQRAFECQVSADHDWSTAEMWDSGIVSSPDSSSTYSGAPLSDTTVYYFRIRLFDGSTWGTWEELRFRENSAPISPGVIYVPLDQPTIQKGIDAAADGDTVLVSPGTYSGTLLFPGRKIVVKSTDGPLSTVITGASTADLVVFSKGEGAQTVLEGFTLQGGKYGILCQNSGPTIRRNLLLGQHCDNWAAIVLTGKAPAHVINNTILSSTNGGISSYSTVAPTIENNIVGLCRNYGIHLDNSLPIILNYNDSYQQLNNYSGISGPRVGNLENVDPKLTSSYQLTAGSLCINAGDPDPLFNDPDGTRSDMGAIPWNCCSGGTRGDISGDGVVDLADLARLVTYLTSPNVTLPCKSAANVNGLGIIDSSDLSLLSAFLTNGGVKLANCL